MTHTHDGAGSGSRAHGTSYGAAAGGAVDVGPGLSVQVEMATQALAVVLTGASIGSSILMSNQLCILTTVETEHA